MYELYYELALSKVQHVGPVTAKNLISYCGSAEAVFKEKKSRLKIIPNIGPTIVEQIDLERIKSQVDQEIKFLEKEKVKVLFYLKNDYPSRLKHYPESPTILYYKGTIDLNHPRTLAVVGTRNMTEYGRTLTEKLIQGLKNADVLVISGLAYGVDSTAHRTAVIEEIPTLGVLGHGLDKLYPFENKNLAEKMKNHGGLLSQFGIKTKPDRENFPLRNRIVAALSDAVVVVETKNSGGSIITAEFANEYNKDVFAFPGRVQDEYSAGCNGLIKNNKAMLIESSQDVLDTMQWVKDKKVLTSIMKPELVFELSPDENSIVSMLDQSNKTHIDQIHSRLRFTPGSLAGLLLNLEFKGVIKELPGKFYLLNN